MSNSVASTSSTTTQPPRPTQTTTSMPILIPDQDTFLTNPSPPSCTSALIDFAQTPLPEYTPHFALLIHDLLSAEECRQLLSLAESTTSPAATWSPAQVNVGGGLQRLMLDARNCGRIIWDDLPIAARIMARIAPHLPGEIVTLRGKACVMGYGPVKREETWRISRLNERLRFLKYTRGMYFREHCDGTYVTPDGGERSFLTVHVYLNGGEDANTAVDKQSAVQRTAPSIEFNSEQPLENQPLLGGATRFFSDRGKAYMDISPERGACLVFQHRGLIHSGEEVLQGIKYTMRSDVMYEKVEA